MKKDFFQNETVTDILDYPKGQYCLVRDIRL